MDVKTPPDLEPPEPDKDWYYRQNRNLFFIVALEILRDENTELPKNLTEFFNEFYISGPNDIEYI